MTCADSKLKRENYLRVKHDPSFSKWKVLVGPLDWQNYYLGLEGATKYRLHNLPPNGITGLYELGIFLSDRKPDLDCILVVYIGQADDLRSRLQSYGRSGAHLGCKCSFGGCCTSDTRCLRNGPGLFEEVFKRGCGIVFRWARMEDKRSAERTEAKLLSTFDYAWNKEANGSRRSAEILLKIVGVQSQSLSYNVYNRILRFTKGAVGVKIEARLPATSIGNDKGFLSAVFKSLSAPFPHKVDANENLEYRRTCGMVIGNSSPCRRLPVSGRRRCEEHIGMRICKAECKKKSNRDSVECNALEKIPCGVNLGDGRFCTMPATKGRVRCQDHKGLKVNSILSKGKLAPQTWENQFQKTLCNVSTKGASCYEQSSDLRSSIVRTSSSSSISDKSSNVCYSGGAISIDTSSCGSVLIQANEPCGQHNNLKVDDELPKIAGRTQVIGSTILEASSPYVIAQIRNGATIIVCGATLVNGSQCRRRVTPGSQRCWQHKVMNSDAQESSIAQFIGHNQVFPEADHDSTLSGITMAGSMYEMSVSSSSSSKSFNSVPTRCEKLLSNGLFCKRKPTIGSKKCWQHKDDSSFITKGCDGREK